MGVEVQTVRLHVTTTCLMQVGQSLLFITVQLKCEHLALRIDFTAASGDLYAQVSGRSQRGLSRVIADCRSIHSNNMFEATAKATWSCVSTISDVYRLRSGVLLMSTNTAWERYNTRMTASTRVSTWPSSYLSHLHTMPPTGRNGSDGGIMLTRRYHLDRDFLGLMDQTPAAAWARCMLGKDDSLGYLVRVGQIEASICAFGEDASSVECSDVPILRAPATSSSTRSWEKRAHAHY